ncbi:H-NS family nucleoid-associated regulatory protein [Paraburkholderia sp. DHOC27]|uniref:H-NS family nucleoid-associated regulatory protein n=1 Tax=Paraburkholderia sp. DHOC27 TaxID=2303330 RepID=UPI000E3E93F8|nr:H-NS family nucleoid-associated regulatory protein [Paraburkholderia sp. DHOC27]RFU43731.1 H-NS histone family protein [Paraburkholderia sp. DHOC27]
MDERKRDSIVAYLRHRMEEFDITPEALASSIAADQMKAAASRYQSATGETWDGHGEMPQWLKQATSAGQSMQHFKIPSESKAKAEARSKQVDWLNDPFAGSPLAQSAAR